MSCLQRGLAQPQRLPGESQQRSHLAIWTPEAHILDEGTQYAVSLDADSIEVHVFDGSVIWIAERGDSEFEDRIGSGEAKRFTRAAPNRPHRIPFGQRQFVRRIESDIRNAAGAGLLAYDGFENLAGQLRRGRSGFGWAGAGYLPVADADRLPRSAEHD